MLENAGPVQLSHFPQQIIATQTGQLIYQKQTTWEQRQDENPGY